MNRLMTTVKRIITIILFKPRVINLNGTFDARIVSPMQAITNTYPTKVFTKNKVTIKTKVIISFSLASIL